MPRTNTTSRTSFTRPNSVTYDLPDPSSSSTVVTITLPPGSAWTSGLHWHEKHTEFLQILQGTALITLSNKTQTYDSTSGLITVPRYARHEWRRVSPDGPPLVVQEWTEPGDGEKEVFFRNLSSVIEDETRSGPPREWWLTWQLFVVFWGLDNWPVLMSAVDVPGFGRLLHALGLTGWFEWIVTHVVLRVAVLVGGVVGLKSICPEYTPRRLRGGKEEKLKC
ncbi:uncharacterized protein PAC_00942 [Phialocephala subalpina]|uniref:Cupin 2 conserved barrel domain-containing protein n=1 Tax=Phialocephala subalpina TaxID=576137 RepID=A0A1L7WE61_9HELO|nr:uncharacterized protein PAC_00942 [Phialocephala subalpina]